MEDAVRQLTIVVIVASTFGTAMYVALVPVLTVLLHLPGVAVLALAIRDIRARIVVFICAGYLVVFSFLPQAECGAAFEEYFATPHGLDFRGAVEMYGCAFTRVASWEQFREAVARALHAERTSVIEVPVDRARNVELHRAMWGAAREGLAGSR